MILFGKFFSIFFIFSLIYWLLPRRKAIYQNTALFIANILFYIYFSFKYLLLLSAIIIFIYIIGIALERYSDKKNRRYIFWLGLTIAIGNLFIFKYYNFFLNEFLNFFSGNLQDNNLFLLNILAPIGISFYTFRLISYIIDIYLKRIHATKNFANFYIYISFFPCIISGPIDRSATFLGQLSNPRVFDKYQVSNGLRQILWGVFKKIVIADNCSVITTKVFENYTSLPSSALLLGAIFFTVQLYADFSGYSDIAIGSSRLLGLNISKNFMYPFFSTNMSEFWRKWHISLTSWLTDYIFTPLNFSLRQLNSVGLVIAILINFTICGFWHGANWTYIAFGLLNGIYFIPLILTGSIYKKSTKTGLISVKNLPSMGFVFLLFSFTLIFFRSPDIYSALNYIKLLFTKSLFTLPYIPNSKSILIQSTIFTLLMFILEWRNRNKDFPLYNLENNFSIVGRYLIYYLLLIMIIVFQPSNSENFIYVQF